MLAMLLPLLAPILGDTLKRFVPDPIEAQRLQTELTLAIMSHQQQIDNAAGEIIKAEAQSEHWLAATWRPILMLTFGALIVARWVGWSAPGLAEAEVLALWDIVELGLGGYVIGRTVEKVAPSVVTAMKK
jgi:hypothetical protein